METSLLGRRVVFIREHFLYDGTSFPLTNKISYKGLMGKIVNVDVHAGKVTVVVCPENVSVPMTTIDVSYLQIVKTGNENNPNKIKPVLPPPYEMTKGACSQPVPIDNDDVGSYG